MKKTFLYISLLALISFTNNSNAQNSTETLGEKLVKEFWGVLKSGTIDSYADRISESFLALHYYGADNKVQEIKLIKTIKLGEYKLSDFTESRTGNTIIVTYKVSADEELYGQKMKPSYRMTIWQNINDVWMLMAHCVMFPQP